MTSFPREIENALGELADLSVVAEREARGVLATLSRHGEPAMADWVRACIRLVDWDRNVGRAFLRASPEADRCSDQLLAWTRQALRFPDLPVAPLAAEGFLDNLPRAYAILGRGGEARWWEIGIQWCERHPASGMAWFRTPVDDLAGRLRRAGIEQMADFAEDLYEARRLTLATHLAGAIKVRNLLGAQALVPWALRGADLLQAGRLRGEAYFRLESEECLHGLLDHLPGYRATDHQRLLAMLAGAWFGAAPALRDSDWSPERGRPFVETDGTGLLLPAVLPDREEGVVAVLHAAAHLAFGTYAPGSLASLDLGGGASAWDALFAGEGEGSRRLAVAFDLCEDLRVDAAANRLIPNHLRRLLALAQSREPPQGPAGAYWDLARDTLRAALGEPVPGPAARLAPLLRPDAVPADALALARTLVGEGRFPLLPDEEALQHAYLPGRGPNWTARLVAEPGAEASGGKQRGTAGGGGGSGDGSESPASADGPPETIADTVAAEGGRTGGEAGSGETRLLRISAPGAAAAGERGTPYPEWDYRDRRYRRDWAWVQERRLAEPNPAEAAKLRARHGRTLARLRRAIQAQKPTRSAPRRGQLEGDEIDLDSALRFAMDRRAGLSPPPAVFLRREPRQREVSVLLLADLSTSVMQVLPEGGRVIDRIRAGVLLFAQSLEMVGDAYAIAGFSSKYREHVSYFPVKEFGEPLTSGVEALIGGMSGRLATRMGAAIRHAQARFADAPARRRLLILLSDGRPEDYDDGGDLRYLHEDTRMAVKEAVDRGIHPFCVTVDPAGGEYLPRIFGPGHYLVLDDIDRLPDRLPEIYLRLRR